MTQEFHFRYELLSSENELSDSDKALVQAARSAAAVAYAPYSGFQVGAAALLRNGQTVTGSNQENASFPAGICAERSLLSAAAQNYPEVPIDTMAVTYVNTKGKSDVPASPCGFCRQVLAEFEKRVSAPIRLILCGVSGEVMIIPASSHLLPLGFSGENLR